MRRINEVFALPITGENLSGTIRAGMTDTNEESAIAALAAYRGDK